MFDFEKLDVYQHLHQLNLSVLHYLREHSQELDPVLRDKLRSSVQAAAFQLAEGTGMMMADDKRRFYTSSRSAIFAAVAALRFLRDMDQLPDKIYDTWYEQCETVSKMLLSMYRNVR